jgi:hypothetical protein
MHIPLSEFEQHVRPDPLERGLTIYERGQVESIHSLGKGLVEAVVQDSDGTWHPQIKIEKEAITAAKCKCDQGGDSLCRHAIAVVFAMEAGQFKEGITTKSGKAPKEKAPSKGRGRPRVGDEPAAPKAVKAKPPKPPKPIKTAADIIARVPHEELVAFLLQECKLDKNIELRLKAHFSDLLPATTVSEIDKRISETFKAAEGKKGKMSKGSIGVLVKRLHEWALESGRMIEAQSFDLAFAAASRVVLILSEMPGLTDSALEEAKAAVKIGMEHIERLAKLEMPEPMRAEVLKRAMEYQEGYNRHFSFLKLASTICKAGPESMRCEALFKYYHDDSVEVTKAQWEMVRRVDGAEAAAAFAKKNATARYFMMQEIDALRKAGDRAKALKLARKGFSTNQHHPTRLGHWSNLEHEILTEMQDVEGLVQLSLKLHRLGYQTTKVSLRNIAEVAGRDRWIAERAILLADKDIRKWQHQESVLALFEVDQDWAALADYVLKQNFNTALTWSANVGRRIPEAAWMVVTKLLENAFKKPGKMGSHQLTEMIRELVALRGKELALEFIKTLKSSTTEPIISEVIKTWDKLTAYMYERSRYGY